MNRGRYQSGRCANPACGDPKRCSIGADGAGFCRSSPPAGADFLFIAPDGARADAAPQEPSFRENLAPLEKRHAIYSALIERLPLARSHREDLASRRGIPGEDLARLGYGSLPDDMNARRGTLSEAMRACGMTYAADVPGVYQSTTSRTHSLAGAPGILIPVRAPSGAIRGMRIRADEPGERGKYRWLSAPTSTDCVGAGADTTPHVALAPTVDAEPGTVRVTEGEIKADVATLRTGIRTIGLAGVSMWAHALPLASELGAKRVLLAFDRDASSNPQVARELARCADAFAELLGAENVGLEVWPGRPDDAGRDRWKGIDDVLLDPTGGAEQIKQRWGVEAFEDIAAAMASAGADADPRGAPRALLAGLAKRRGEAFNPDVLRAALALRQERNGQREYTGAAEFRDLRAELAAAGVDTAKWERAIALAACPANRDPIEVTPDEHITGKRLTAALAARDPALYQRAGMLVHVVEDLTPIAGITRAAASPHIVDVKPPLLRNRAAAVAWWFEYGAEQIPVAGGDGEKVRTTIAKQKRPDGMAIAAVHAAGQWDGIRPLTAVVESPVLRPDGTVLDRQGYDPATGILAVFRQSFPRVSENPTHDDARAALEVLKEPFVDFPFVGEADRAVVLAGVVTPLAKQAFRGPSPAFALDAASAGTGKSLLADTLGELIAGRPMARMAPADKDDEMRKRITAIALAGVPHVLVDNVAAALGGAALDAAITATTWRDRVLGESRDVELPLDVTWYFTGNNMQFIGDTVRRIARARMVSQEERPEERGGFKHPNLLPWVRENRGRIICAALTILRAYCVAGRPSQKLLQWGSFEGWSDLVRNALVWSGAEDLGKTREELRRETDTSRNALGDLLDGWQAIAVPFGGKCTVAQVLRELDRNTQASSGPYGSEPRRYDALRDALAELCPAAPGKLPSVRQVGNYLKYCRDRIVSGKAFAHAGDDRNGSAVWTVRTTTRGEPKSSSAGSAESAGSSGSHASEGDSPVGESHGSGGSKHTPHTPQTPHAPSNDATPPPRVTRVHVPAAKQAAAPEDTVEFDGDGMETGEL